MTIGIVADDLTGGAAIAGEITPGRGPVTVTAWHQDTPSSGPAVIDTASRFAPADVSAHRVQQATQQLLDNDFGIVMKKIDSTLKGNVATDLAAFAHTCRAPLLIAPACPEVGLGLHNGRQTTPSGPGRDVTAMLTDFLPRPPALLKLDTVRAGASAVEAWLKRHTGNHILADAITPEDLATITAAAARCSVTSFAGTYGLGAALASGGNRGSRDTDEPQTVNRLLVLAGSASPVTAAQVARFSATGALDITCDTTAVLSGQTAAEAQRIGRLVAEASPAIVVHTDPLRTSTTVDETATRRGWTPRDIAEQFAPVFTAAINAAPNCAVLLIGGETTGAVIDSIGLHTYTVTDEIAPGVPRGLTSRTDVSTLLTKPGAFGHDNTIVDVAHRLLTR